MPRSRNINWGAILLEASFVVLGVVLAFSVNQCRERRAEEDRGSHALESIRQELARNRELVQANKEYHYYLADTLQAYLRPGAANPQISLFSKGFIAQSQPLATAWETAKHTDALRHMDYNTVLQLSAIYQQQERYQFQANEIGGNLYQAMMSEGRDSVLSRSANLLSIIYMFIYKEQGLLEAYENFEEVEL